MGDFRSKTLCPTCLIGWSSAQHVRITDSPGGINNHPVIYTGPIRLCWCRVYLRGFTTKPSCEPQKIVPASWRLLWRALVVLTINIQYTGIAEYFFTSVKNDCIAPSCDHPRAVVSRAQCTVRTFHLADQYAAVNNRGSDNLHPFLWQFKVIFLVRITLAVIRNSKTRITNNKEKLQGAKTDWSQSRMLDTTPDLKGQGKLKSKLTVHQTEHKIRI